MIHDHPIRMVYSLLSFRWCSSICFWNFGCSLCLFLCSIIAPIISNTKTIIITMITIALRFFWWILSTLAILKWSTASDTHNFLTAVGTVNTTKVGFNCLVDYTCATYKGTSAGVTPFVFLGFHFVFVYIPQYLLLLFFGFGLLGPPPPKIIMAISIDKLASNSIVPPFYFRFLFCLWCIFYLRFDWFYSLLSTRYYFTYPSVDYLNCKFSTYFAFIFQSI